jgi:hypothetical protein
MLGLRQYKGCAIDIWQGSVSDFLVDALAYFEGPELDSGPLGQLETLVIGPNSDFTGLRAKFSSLAGAQLTGPGTFPACCVVRILCKGQPNQTEYGALFQSTFSLQLRHIGHFVAFSKDNPEEHRRSADLALGTLRAILDQQAGGHRPSGMRLTFITPDAASYSVYQSALFSVFPEKIT